MAIASTGPLALKLTIRAEELIKNSSLPPTDVSTREISESAGFSEPDAFSEFYGYSSAVLPTMASIRVSGGPNDSYIAFAATPATTGFVALTSRGFYFGTDYRGPQYNTRYQVDTSNSLGEFSRGFGGLAGATTYYCWGYVQNQIGEAYTARSQGTTQRVIPITITSEGSFYGHAEGPMYMPQYHGGNAGKTSPELRTEILSQRSCNDWGGYYFLQQFYARQFYLHPYYGWVSNVGSDMNWEVYTNWRYDDNGWGDANHQTGWYGNMKIADGGATRQRKLLHAVNNVTADNCSGTAYIDFGGWYMYSDMSYSGIGSYQTFTKEESAGFDGYGVSNYIGGDWSGGYAPYSSWGRYMYANSTMYSYYSGYYLVAYGNQYWYRAN
jgi:hypothetical protein